MGESILAWRVDGDLCLVNATKCGNTVQVLPLYWLTIFFQLILIAYRVQKLENVMFTVIDTSSVLRACCGGI